MDSLYSGRPGVSFVLKARFDSVEDMVKAFQDGPNYKTVWYSEYCIIDTPNKNDKTNGQIYQRGLDYHAKDADGNPTGGAIYVGQIVGPESGTPLFQLGTIPEVEEHVDEPLGKYDYKCYATAYKYDDNSNIIGYETSDGSDGAPLGQFAFSNAHHTSLVPGKYLDNLGEIAYRDEIKYSWCNIRKNADNEESWFYVGFEIPYLITDYSIHMTSPYDENGDILESATEIERIDDQTHPFYSHWDLGIPKGVKGDTLRNLRVIVPTEEDKIYEVGALSIDPTDNSATIDTSEEYAGKADDVENQRQILVFDFYAYDKKQNPEPYTIYLGDFNIITEINLEDDGTLVVSYTHDDDTEFIQKIRWINQIDLTEGNGNQGGHFTFTYNVDVDPTAENPVKLTKEFDVSWIKGLEIEQDGSVVYTYAGTPDELPAGAVNIEEGRYRVEDFLQWLKNIQLDSETGVFTVTNNRDEEIFTTTLDWIKDIVLDEDGTLHFIHTKDGVDDVYSNYIKTITDVSLTQDGIFKVEFNTNSTDTYTSQLDWMDNLYIDEETGEIAFHHVDETKNTSPAVPGKRPAAEVIEPAKLKLIVRAELTENGSITFFTNTGESIPMMNAGSNTEYKLKTIDDVTLLEGIKDDKHIQIKYNVAEEYVPIGDSLNYIKDAIVRSDDWHLLILWGDPTHRFIPPADLEDLPNKYVDLRKRVWVNNITSSDGTKYDPDVYWQDMGSIKDQSGVLIGFNLTRDTLTNAGWTGTVLEYLDSKFPQGLTGSANEPGGANVKDKIVTYGGDGSNKSFYAYDYDKKKWYYLGALADDGMRDAMLTEDSKSTTITNDMDYVHSRGLLFIRNAYTPVEDIPQYWSKDYTDWA